METLRRVAAGTAIAGIIATAGMAGGITQANAAPAKPTTTATTWSDPGLRLCSAKWIPGFCDKYRG